MEDVCASQYQRLHFNHAMQDISEIASLRLRERRKVSEPVGGRGVCTLPKSEVKALGMSWRIGSLDE